MSRSGARASGVREHFLPVGGRETRAWLGPWGVLTCAAPVHVRSFDDGDAHWSAEVPQMPWERGWREPIYALALAFCNSNRLRERMGVTFGILRRSSEEL